MAKRRSKSNARRRNATRVVATRRRSNSHRRRMNPDFFGKDMQYAEIGKYVVSGLAGVAVTKAVVPMLPASIVGSNAMRFAASLGVALAAGYAASFIGKDIGSGVLFGGLMQAASTGLNAFFPAASPYLGLSGYRNSLGEFVPASFPVPQTPVVMSGPSHRLTLQAPSRMTAYGTAY